MLYQIKIESCFSIFNEFPYEFQRMKEIATRKRKLHAKNLKKIERSFNNIPPLLVQKMEKMYGYKASPSKEAAGDNKCMAAEHIHTILFETMAQMERSQPSLEELNQLS